MPSARNSCAACSEVSRSRTQGGNKVRRLSSLLILFVTLTLSFQMVLAQTAGPIVEDFSAETVGSAPVSFSTPSGWWSIGTDGTSPKPLLFEDGTRYSAQSGVNSVAAQAQAQAQGQNLHQLADAQLTYFPVALFNAMPNFSEGTITAEFAIVGGDADT